MEYKRSISRSVERTRLAKMRFLNENVNSTNNNNNTSDSGLMSRGSASRRSLPIISKTDRLPEIDLSIPGTPVSSRYVMALRGKNDSSIGDIQSNIGRNDTETITKTDAAPAAGGDDNPFTIFINSMNKLNAGKLKEGDSEDILGLLIKMEGVATKRSDDSNKYGYSNVGTYNGTSNLRISPAVQRSYVRRLSLQNNPEVYDSNENTLIKHETKWHKANGTIHQYLPATATSNSLKQYQHHQQQGRRRRHDELDDEHKSSFALQFANASKFKSIRDKFEPPESKDQGILKLNS